MTVEKTTDILYSVKVTTSKLIFLIQGIYIILGTLLSRNYQRFDDYFYLLITLGVISAVAGILSLFIDCTGKHVKALLCLVLWHTFLGICLGLSINNVEKKYKDRQEENIASTVSIVYIALYMTMCLFEVIFIYKERRKHDHSDNLGI